MEQDPGGAGPMVQGFVPGGFRVDGAVFRAVLMTVTEARAWSPPPLAGLTPDDLRFLGESRPEFILLGTGPASRRPSPALVRSLEDAGIGIEPMDSRAAARAWGILRSEGRRIGAALYPVA